MQQVGHRFRNNSLYVICADILLLGLFPVSHAS